jgi:hypothetical protein
MRAAVSAEGFYPPQPSSRSMQTSPYALAAPRLWRLVTGRQRVRASIAGDARISSDGGQQTRDHRALVVACFGSTSYSRFIALRNWLRSSSFICAHLRLPCRERDSRRRNIIGSVCALRITSSQAAAPYGGRGARCGTDEPRQRALDVAWRLRSQLLWRVGKAGIADGKIGVWLASVTDAALSLAYLQYDLSTSRFRQSRARLLARRRDRSCRGC